MERSTMSTTILMTYSSVLSGTVALSMGVEYLFGQASPNVIVDAVGAASDLKGPMLFAFLIVVLVLWSLNKMSTASMDSQEKQSVANNLSHEKTALTNKEALQHVTQGFSTFKTELDTEIGGIKIKQDEHSKELGHQRNEITKLVERLPNACKAKTEEN